MPDTKPDPKLDAKLVRDYISVKAQPTVVRLDHLKGADVEWISAAFFVTSEVEQYLHTIKANIEKKHGSGYFLIGQYGSGKSHFLAYLTQQLSGQRWLKTPPAVYPISLLNYPADIGLEQIIGRELGGMVDDAPEPVDRREQWSRISSRSPTGIFLILDELSEYLRSKKTPQAFNEDIRFLQFLGEWSQDKPLWILAALQEQIEHTGVIEGSTFRKIKDRFPYRFLLSPAHVKDLLQKQIFSRSDRFEGAIEKWLTPLKSGFPGLTESQLTDLKDSYPVHPATLDLLEEIRDLFSQSRGVVGFILKQMHGDDAAGMSPFLIQQPPAKSRWNVVPAKAGWKLGLKALPA